MKKCLMFLASAIMALSLTACTPTPEKKQEEQQTIPTTEAYVADTMEKRNKGNENLPVLATVSIYRMNKTGDGLVQEMDSLETEELQDQAIIDMMIEYGILEEGTEIISFEFEDDKGVLNLNKITSAEDAMKIRVVVESIVNTFTENYELEAGLILQENGEVYTLEAMNPEEDGTMYYNTEYRKFTV